MARPQSKHHTEDSRITATPEELANMGGSGGATERPAKKNGKQPTSLAGLYLRTSLNPSGEFGAVVNESLNLGR